MIEQLGAGQLDWSGHRTSWDASPCHACGKPALMRDRPGRACHKVCAEPPPPAPDAVPLAQDVAPRPLRSPLPRQNPFGAALATCGACEAYGVPWGSACSACGQSKGYPLPIDAPGTPKSLDSALFARPPAEVITRGAPHPAPIELAAEVAPGDPRVPRQPARIHAAALKAGWSPLVLSYGRGSDLGSAGEPGPACESVMLTGARPGARFVAVWVTSSAYVCASCDKPLKPIQNGTFRKHGPGCPGSGQLAAGQAVPVWEMVCAYFQGGSLFDHREAMRPGFEQLRALIVERA